MDMTARELVRALLDGVCEATSGSAWLHRHLGTTGDYDPYRYDYLIPKWSEDNGVDLDGVDPDLGYEGLPSDLQDDFQDWLNDNMHNMVQDGDISPVDQDPRDYFGTPTHVKPNEWLIHFSNAADQIWSGGFKYGADTDTMHLTKHVSEPGYGEWAFAFIADEVPNIGDKYGSEAVMFKSSSAIVAYHYGDNEPQVVFNRNEAPVRDLVYLRHDEDEDEWYVGDNDHPYVQGKLEDVISWVKNNYDQYRRKL